MAVHELRDPRVADAGLGGYPLPVAASLLESVPDFGVEWLVHEPMFAKFCAPVKQPIASHGPQSLAMARKSLNQVLAENLRSLMGDHGLSAAELGRRAKVAPNTIGNYLRLDEPQHTARGKERSAKLTEVEAIAAVLGIHPMALLTDPAEQQARAHQIAQLLAGDLPVPPSAPPSSGSRKRLPRAA